MTEDRRRIKLISVVRRLFSVVRSHDAVRDTEFDWRGRMKI
jgi:hypothetical protein